MSGVLPEDSKQILEGLLDPAKFEDSLALLGSAQARFESLFRYTANPTIVRSGSKFNVIPGDAWVDIDSRILPGRTVKDVVVELNSLLGKDVYIEVVASGPKTNRRWISPFSKPFPKFWRNLIRKVFQFPICLTRAQMAGYWKPTAFKIMATCR